MPAVQPNQRSVIQLIESGSLSAGVNPLHFDLPAGTALRYERPDPRLRALLPSYVVLDSDPAVWKGPDSWLLPGWPQIWIVLTEAPITVGIRYPSVLGSAMVFGGSSRAMPVTSQGGVSVVIDVSPAGWARLFDTPADRARDRLMPLEDLAPTSGLADLVSLLHASDRALEVKPLLDAFFLNRLPPPHPAEADIRQIHAALGDHAGDAADIAARLAITPRDLLARCNRHFGYGPTVLKRRRRFLRVLTTMLTSDAPPNFSKPPPGYYDAAHFLRDGNLFLGMTPRRFLKLPMPYLRAVLRARTIVLGEPLPMFDDFDGFGAPDDA